MSDATHAKAVVPAEKPGKKFPVLIAGGLAALLIAGGGAYMVLGSGGAGGTAGVETARPAYFLDLPQITVNLNTSDDSTAYLRLSIALEVGEEEMLEVIAPRMPRVLDAFQVYLRELRRSDLEGSAGVYRLKEELQRRINIAVHPAVVDDILFKEILVQ